MVFGNINGKFVLLGTTSASWISVVHLDHPKALVDIIFTFAINLCVCVAFSSTDYRFSVAFVLFCSFCVIGCTLSK